MKSKKFSLKSIYYRLASCFLAIIFLLSGTVSAIDSFVYCERIGVEDPAACTRVLRQQGIAFVDVVDTSAACSLDSSQLQTETLGKKLFVMGDSLTVGMVRSGGLLDKLRSGGFNLTTEFEYTPGERGSGNVSGPSLDATGGIGIINSTKKLPEHSNDIKNSDTILIALGTNREDNYTERIKNFVVDIRAYNPDIHIVWLNTYFRQNESPPAYLDVNDSIIKASQQIDKFSIVDIVADTESGDILKPDGGDDIHFGGTGYQKRSQWLADKLSNLSIPVSSTTGIDSTGVLGFNPLSLYYPSFPNEAEIIQKLKDYILKEYSNSPFAANLEYVDQIFTTSKRADRNINPLLVLSIAKQENGFGQANSSATDNNNYFGITQGPRDYRQFPSVEEGIDYFVEKVSRHVTNPEGAYEGLTNFYEYLSVHQVGLIAYPGEYPDNAPGKDATPPYLTYDERMDVYTSWDVTRNSHRPGWNADTKPIMYNPGIYFRNSINLINSLTGLSLSTTPDRGDGGVYGSGACGASSTIPAGEAFKYIPDCGVNGGNAAIACTAINQLVGIPYDNDKRAPATDQNPEFLDCSALTGMALYRTFGVDLNGLCSVEYLSNENFEIIDVRDVLPGDFVGKGTICGIDESDVFGHVALVVSYDASAKKLITVETGSAEYLSGLRGTGAEGTYNVGFEVDGNGNYTWAVRYVGEKTIQLGAL